MCQALGWAFPVYYLSDLVLSSPRGQYHNYPPFTNEVTDSERSDNLPKKWQGQDSNPSLITSKIRSLPSVQAWGLTQPLQLSFLIE